MTGARVLLPSPKMLPSPRSLVKIYHHKNKFFVFHLIEGKLRLSFLGTEGHKSFLKELMTLKLPLHMKSTDWQRVEVMVLGTRLLLTTVRPIGHMSE